MSLEEQLEASEKYAAEGWAWLDEALEALGIKTVFEIKGRKEQLETYEKALRLIQATPRLIDTHHIARRALSSPASTPRYDRNEEELIATCDKTVDCPGYGIHKPGCTKQFPAKEPNE